MKLKIAFTDFWPGFNPDDNYLVRVLGKKFQLELSSNPDVLIFSCYGIEHLNYKCTKVQYLPENLRPDFNISDFVISFDYLNNSRHLRLPLYTWYFDDEYTVEKLLRKKSEEEIDAIYRSKKEFCCFLVSNASCQTRVDFFHQLSKYKKVHSGGRVLNNVGGQVKNKLNFLRDFKFIIAFENGSSPGYTTEKVLEPKQVDTVPIYWGNPLIGQEMNTSSFVNFHDYGSFDKLYEKVIEIDNNETLYKQYLAEPLFYKNQPNEYFDETRLFNFFDKIIESSKTQVPVSQLPSFRKTSKHLRVSSFKYKFLAKFFNRQPSVPWIKNSK